MVQSPAGHTPLHWFGRGWRPGRADNIEHFQLTRQHSMGAKEIITVRKTTLL